jgi:hypothetical protein
MPAEQPKSQRFIHRAYLEGFQENCDCDDAIRFLFVNNLYSLLDEVQEQLWVE